MSLTTEQKIRLAQSAEFQKILQTDPVLDELERSRFNMDDERAALLCMFGCKEYRLGKRTIYPLTPAVWSILWASGNRLCNDSTTVTAKDIDTFFYLLSFRKFKPIASTLDNLQLQSAGFCSDCYDDAAKLSGRILCDAFYPLSQLPVSNSDSGTPVYGADWLAALVMIVHEATGATVNDVYGMPMSAVTSFFVANARKSDTHHAIFKKTDTDVAKKIIERTEQLAEEYLLPDLCKCQDIQNRDNDCRTDKKNHSS